MTYLTQTHSSYESIAAIKAAAWLLILTSGDPDIIDALVALIGRIAS